jgi:hypothetical protein
LKLGAQEHYCLLMLKKEVLLRLGYQCRNAFDGGCRRLRPRHREMVELSDTLMTNSFGFVGTDATLIIKTFAA